jgi:hypothetical protein
MHEKGLEAMTNIAAVSTPCTWIIVMKCRVQLKKKKNFLKKWQIPDL